MAVTLKTPGVYLNEVNAFPNSVVAVPTAIPVFIGYTQRADYQGKSYVNQAVRIESLSEFLTFFGVLDDTSPASDLVQYQPIYRAVPSAGDGDIVLGDRRLDLCPDPGTIYYLYNSVKLFYQNGGGPAYVVSVGFIGQPTGQALQAGSPLVNPNVQYSDLVAGLTIAAQEWNITMIVAPDALLLGAANYAAFLQEVLTQCGELGSRVGVLDVYGGEAPNAGTFLAPNGEIETFRAAIGTENLRYGAAYFPFLQTTIVEDSDLNYLNFGGVAELAAILPNANVDPLKTILAQIATPPADDPPTPGQLENALLGASPDYQALHDRVLAKINILPPSGALAGVFATVDVDRGVWVAPANVSLTSVVDTTLKITDQTQAPLNVDTVTGKSINAIRLFPGSGVMVWGARTLDGNSQDWRYLNACRTVIMIEQSIKQALRAYVFAPNVATTWSLIQSMIVSFLTTLWRQGGLVGSSAASAFTVAVGLGATMTSDDILNGILKVTVQVAVTHPAEFIVLTVSQQQQTA